MPNRCILKKYCNLNLTDGSLSQSFIVSHGDGGAVCVAWFRLDCE